MSYVEFNVAFRTPDGRLRLAHSTWTREELARKRQEKFTRAGGCVNLVRQPGGDWVKERTPALLVKRTISDPEVVE